MKYTTIIVILLFTISFQLIAQDLHFSSNNFVPTLNRKLSENELYNIKKSDKKKGHFDRNEWSHIIDSIWGDGIPISEKLALFDTALAILDHEYGAYFNIDIDLDSIVALYRPEIEGGVSRGRFAAIMNYISLYMQDSHTTLIDIPVNWGTPLLPGVPLFVIGGFSSNSHFGACLTPLEDSSLLVYKSLPNQRLGIVAGDIVLGYDGIPWKVLYKELMAIQMPIHTTWVWGSTDESITHQILISAGMNWHLFDTIDIIKHSTGDTIHVSTEPMQYQVGPIWGNEQLPVAGIEQPDISNEEYVTWGIIDGTDIGYVYIASYDDNPDLNIFSNIHNAIYDFMYTYETSGFIIDYRLNYGGTIDNEYLIYKLLFDETIYTIGYDERDDPEDHFSMTQSPWATPYLLRIPGNSNSYYDKPIAILTGPGTVSCGDVESMRMSFHDKTSYFGKPSAGAFTISQYPDLGNPDWFFYLATGSAFKVDGHDYLCHTGVEVDHHVWLTQEGIISGVDNVADSAINWIISETQLGYFQPIGNDNALKLECYPNPFHKFSKITYSLHQERNVLITIYDTYGRKVVTLVNRWQKEGKHFVNWYGKNALGINVKSGIYICEIETDNTSAHIKLIKN